jgi:hypothetical protein
MIMVNDDMSKDMEESKKVKSKAISVTGHGGL